jgi:hypothetical protein
MRKSGKPLEKIGKAENWKIGKPQTGKLEGRKEK